MVLFFKKELLLSFILSGCVAASRPITIAQALDELQTQLQAAGAVSATAAGAGQFEAAALAAQCAARTANPAVPFLSHEITVNLTGSFTATGSFAVGPAATGGPPFGLSAGGTRAQTQGLTLPLTFAALSELPDVVTAQRVALYAGLPKAARDVEIARLVAERDELRQRTAAVIASFDAAKCTGTK